MSPVTVVVGIFLLAAAVAAAIVMLVGGSRRASARAKELAGGPQVRDLAEHEAERSFTGVVDRLPLVTSLLQTTRWWEETQLELLRAGVLLKPSELVGITAGTTALGGLLGLLVFHSFGSGLIFAALGAAIPWISVKVKQAKRARDLLAQLPEAIEMMATALRTGFSFLRAVQLIASQMQPPISDEFRRLGAEVQMGMSTDDALGSLVDRTKCYDLELLVAAVQIHLTVGGNLSEILDNISGTIRERVKLQGEIAAATAEGRMSAGVLLAMPFGIAIIINIVNPPYLTPLFTSPLGLAMTLVAGLLMGMGAMVIRRMVEIDI
jgi:tight adherence protein B